MPKRHPTSTRKKPLFLVEISTKLHDFQSQISEEYSVKIAQFKDGSVKAIFNPPGRKKFKKTFPDMESFREYCRENEVFLNGQEPAPSVRDNPPSGIGKSAPF